LHSFWGAGQDYFIGTDIWLSCLLEAKRYDELKEVLAAMPHIDFASLILARAD
jgi:hypothetical protein